MATSSLPAFQNENKAAQASRIPYKHEVESSFQKILEHYQAGQFELTEVELLNLLEVYPSNHRITSILYLLGRSQFRLAKYSNAQQTLGILVETYPRSRYADDGNYLRAASAYAESHYTLSADYLIRLIETSNDLKLQGMAIQRAVLLMTDYLSESQVTLLKARYHAASSMKLFEFVDAISRNRRGGRTQARLNLERLLSETPSGALRDEIDRYLSNLQGSPGSGLKVGVILPLSGFFEEEARGLLRGIQYALRQDSRAMEMGVQLEIRDSMGEMLKTIDAVRDLAFNENVLAIIGEIESDKTAVIGALTESIGIPVIAPTAIESGLVQAGSNIFQMSPDVSTTGEMLAEYAINTLGFKTFAILAPADKYGKNITDGFAHKIDQLNGTIIAEAWYYENATDVREQIRRFRRLGLTKMLRDSLSLEYPDYSRIQIDSTIIALKEQEELEKEEENRPTKLSDSTAVEVTSIDGIFLPLYTEHIRYVAPQLALYNINAQLLGGNYWDDLDILMDNESYVQDAIFPTDYFLSESNTGFRDFRNRFRLEMGSSPGKLEISGFDSMNFLLDGIKSIRGRSGLLDRLSGTGRYDGLVSSYRFERDNRVNKTITILQYRDKSVRKLE